MRFALLGAHPDGVALARALMQTGRHQIAAVTDPPDDEMASWIGTPRLVRDLADVIADPALEAVIVASPLAARPLQLRRALQSERHVLCVHPVDLSPDTAYEAALLQQDTGMVLLPLLPAVFHPGVRRLIALKAEVGGLGAVKLIELELWSRQQVLHGDADGKRWGLPGWEVLRRLGGEVAEVTAFTERLVAADQPLFVSGGFQGGGQLQVSLRPGQGETRGRLTMTGEHGRAELTWSGGWDGPARLTWQAGEQVWDGVDLWGPMGEVFEQHLARSSTARTSPAAPLSWQDEVRCLELDDAVLRSAERRRAVPLEYPEASEEAGFKGTMTLLGCGLLWLIVLLLVLSVWVPVLGWVALPLLMVFLVLQSLLWVARKPREPAPPPPRRD